MGPISKALISPDKSDGNVKHAGAALVPVT